MHQKRLNPYKPLIKHKRSTRVWIIGFILIFLAITYLLCSPLLAITSITINGSFPISADPMADTIKAQLEKKRLIIGTERNILLFSKTDFIAHVKTSYAVNNIQIKKSFPHTLEISIDETPRSAIWIARGINFAVDGQGKILGAAQSIKPNDIQLYSTANIFPSTGDQVIEPRMLKLMSDLSENVQLKTLGIDYISIGDDRAAHKIAIKTKKGFEIILDPSGAVYQQLNSLDKILTQIVPADKISTLEYIDLRFENRIFYKAR